MLTPKDIMAKDVKYIHPDDSLKDAAETMKTFEIGAMPVVRDGKVVGMITDRDILVRAIAEDNDPQSTNIKDAMTAEPITIYEDQGIDEAGRLMKENQVRRLVVLNRNEEISGMFSLGDLATAAIDERTSGDVLESISKPSTS
ncbi:MAG: CBS domain-containing protein [candidate division Zixibacteria bacterium]|nr:CBS domain-containing protein [candidate division Zixibacteria bacterium]